PPAVVGVVFGWLWMHRLEAAIYRPLIGLIILGLPLLQLLRQWRTDWQDRLPHSQGFAWLMGMLVGLTTMLANAAGPIFSLYLLALSIPKLAFVGTSAWFF
ncbi:MAG: TSUP family transporter, partial [Pirellulaceae bacterium]